MKALQLSGYGDPDKVVKLVDLPDVGAPGPDEIVIDVEAVPVEPSDLYIIAGIYGNLPPLPHILGVEGVGRVSAVGRNVKHLKEGDRALTPPFVASWVGRVKTNASWLRPLPTTADVNQLSMLGMNPATAYVLLTEFVQLKRDDWVIINAANSSVGRAVIPIARSRGIRTVNIVRRAELIREIEAIGGDIVLVAGPDLPKRIAAATDNVPIHLALDGVGDSETQAMLDSVTYSGTVVAWSGMSGKPFTASGIQLLFRNQSIRGFWIFNWFRAPDPNKLVAMYEELTPLMASGAITYPVTGVYGFERVFEALALAGKLSGKAILTLANLYGNTRGTERPITDNSSENSLM